MSSSKGGVALLLGDKFPDFEAETTQVSEENQTLLFSLCSRLPDESNANAVVRRRHVCAHMLHVHICTEPQAAVSCGV